MFQLFITAKQTIPKLSDLKQLFILVRLSWVIFLLVLPIVTCVAATDWLEAGLSWTSPSPTLTTWPLHMVLTSRWLDFLHSTSGFPRGKKWKLLSFQDSTASLLPGNYHSITSAIFCWLTESTKTAQIQGITRGHEHQECFMGMVGQGGSQWNWQALYAKAQYILLIVIITTQ